MALKLLIIFVLLYFVARSVGNMVQAIFQGPKAPLPPQQRQDRDSQWQGPSSKPTPRGRSEVEDAKWKDLD